jgi:hypothetical protein
MAVAMALKMSGCALEAGVVVGLPPPAPIAPPPAAAAAPASPRAAGGRAEHPSRDDHAGCATFCSSPPCRRIVPIVTSVAIELDQPLVTDPEVMRDLVEHDVSDLAAQTIGVAGGPSLARRAGCGPGAVVVVARIHHHRGRPGGPQMNFPARQRVSPFQRSARGTVAPEGGG